MARKYIGYSFSGRHALNGLSRTEQGYPLLFLEDNEVETVTFDLVDNLDTSETISTVTATTEGSLTAGTPAINGDNNQATVQFSGAGGWGLATVTITLSTGRVIVEKVEVRNRLRYLAPVSSDYVENWEHWV